MCKENLELKEVPKARKALAHSCTRFPCYLGMEIQTINAKTQWTTTKIVELGN